MIGIDLFAGAGGLSLGAEMAGIDVVTAVEQDKYAADTYARNHPGTNVLDADIREIKHIEIERHGEPLVLFGGPPCQGFSTSNQRTRGKGNPQNWLYREFIRFAGELRPEWIVFENVKGFQETEKGFFEREVLSELEELGYRCSPMKLCAADYGIPQLRTRYFIVCSDAGIRIDPPEKENGLVTVKDAINDLPILQNGAAKDILPYKKKAVSAYAQGLRNDDTECSGNLVTKNSDLVIQRYAHIPQGGNWRNIPDELMGDYADKSRCHTGIYKRLSENAPAITVGNYRKSMIIHPTEDRGLSVREAARLQSFPDSYVFRGSIGFQQQQVGNAVPPLLAERVFQQILRERN